MTTKVLPSEAGYGRQATAAFILAYTGVQGVRHGTALATGDPKNSGTSKPSAVPSVTAGQFSSIQTGATGAVPMAGLGALW